MIIFFEHGKLGNQLFQYCALRNFHRKDALFLIGMQSLKSMFDGVEVVGGKWSEWGCDRIICRIGKKLFTALAKKLHLIGLIEEGKATTGSRIVEKSGWIKSVYYCDNASFFQSEELAEESVAGKLQLKPELLKKGENVFMKFPHDRSATFFVHVRRGDYVYWPAKTSPAVLPFKWYQKQMDLIRSEFSKPFFVVVSDDSPYVDEMFSMYPDVFVSHENEEVDFAMMSLCDGGGILSASSFAWWAAYFARRNNAEAIFIAPLYWAGHRQGDWLPEGVITSWLKYAAVS